MFPLTSELWICPHHFRRDVDSSFSFTSNIHRYFSLTMTGHSIPVSKILTSDRLVEVFYVTQVTPIWVPWCRKVSLFEVPLPMARVHKDKHIQKIVPHLATTDLEVGQRSRSRQEATQKGSSQRSCRNIDVLSLILNKSQDKVFVRDRQMDEWVLMTSKFVELWSPGWQQVWPWRSMSRSWHDANWKDSSQGSCMPNINALSLILEKIWARLKFLWRTDRWTNEF